MNWKSILFLVFIFCFLQVSSGQKTSKKSEKAIVITGKVLTPDKKPIEGAVFYIDNIRTSYKSMSNGSFRIKVSPSVNKLKVSSSVYGSAETIIDGQTTINFTLTDNLVDLTSNPGDEVIETDHSDKKTARGRGRKMNTYTNIYQMIRSELPGVVVSGRSIVVQQQNSFFGSSEPLYVVNGAIVNSIDFISPMEVKSISLLKGSQATIYGVRGANGVISITLLKGSEER